MAKRGLCILLAVLTLFALAVPAFAAEEAPTSGTCGNNLKWSLSGSGTLTISGKGKMADYAWGGTPWYDIRDQIKKVVIKSGVTSIGNEAFDELSNLTSVTIPNGVTRIGLAAFYECTSLTSVKIPGSVTYIDEVAFSGCSSLKSVTIPSSVTTIRTGAFDHTPWLENLSGDFATVNGTLFAYRGDAAKVTIPSSVTSIAGAFWRYENMKSVTIPSSVKTLDHSAFEGCTGLTSITIPGSVTSIGVAAFYDCTGLKSVTIPGSVKTIDEAAFYNCTGLTEMTIPKNVTYIANAAFANCGGLTSIEILNAKCTIDYDDDRAGGVALGVPGATVISGYKGSTAEAYAKKYGYTFKAIDEKPAQLTAPTVKIAQTDGGIQVTWNAVKGSPRYMVYYKENGGKWQQIGSTAKTAYTWKKAKAGATYQFAVRCCDSDKKTLLSGYQASNKLKYTVELDVPAVTIAQTDGGIQVTWNAVEGSPRYMVYYKENGGKWQQIGSTAKTAYTWKKAKAGATYQFAVRCCDSDKKTLLSGYQASNKVKYTVELDTPAVTIAQTKSGIKVTWNAVEGSPRYMVYYKENGGSWTKIGSTAKTAYTWKQAKAGATYQFAVRCCAADKATLLSGYQASNKLKYEK